MEDASEEMAVREVLKYLTEFGYLKEGTPAHGIALQVIDKGRDSLKGNQEDVFERFIDKPFLRLKCKRCGSELPTSEIIGALTEEDGLCSDCRNKESKG